jgi:hypothetical protein
VNTNLLAAATLKLDQAQHLEQRAKYSRRADFDAKMAQAASLRTEARELARQAHAQPEAA